MSQQPIDLDLYGSAKVTTAVPARNILHPVFDKSGYPGFPLGHNPDNRLTGLSFNFDASAGHGLFIGATRAGKFVNILAPALLTTQANCIITDPKGEAAWVTGPRRERPVSEGGLGHRCLYLDPWGEIQRRYGNKAGVTVPISRFNPLSALDPTSPDFNDDVSTIADALIVVNPGQDSHWTDSARELIAGLVAAVVEMDPGQASLREVRELVTASDEELVAKIVQIRNANPHSLAGRKLRRFAPKLNSQGDLVMSDEISSIRSTAETQTAILDSEALLTSMDTDETPFTLSELVTGNVTVYLVLPPDRLNTHGRWLRMILTLAIRTIARMGQAPKLPVCLWLDEMSSLGNLRMIEDSYGLMAGLGVRIFGFLQDLSQLKRDYPASWQTFISNSSIVQLLQCADLETAGYFSEYLGTMTVNAKTGGYSLKQKQYGQPNGYYDMYKRKAKDLFKKHMKTHRNVDVSEETAEQVITVDLNSDKRQLDLKEDTLRSRTWALENTERLLKESGYTELGYMQWEPDTELAERRVMLPQEVRDADSSKSIIIMPGAGNFQLTRFRYYDDPLLSKWARHDPNKPAPKAEEPPPPPPPVPPPADRPRFDKNTGKPIFYPDGL